MARKKSKLKFKIKLNKKQKAIAWTYGLPVVTAFVFLNMGIFGTRFFEARKQPANVVWAADKTVRVPASLRSYLMKQDDCKDYLGTNTRTGVGLWGVYQVSQNKFAKISYGCSFALTNYIMAVKQNGKWQLVPPAEYFSPFANTQTTGALPLCSQLEKYKIDKSVESFCVDASGAAKANTI